MPGNTTFFAKAADMKITWKDIFSNVFKKHTKEDSERLFMAGTMLTTPHESRMLSEWKKPWLFAYAGIAGFIFLGIMYVLSQLMGGETFTVIPMVFIGALIPPLIALLLFWEMNIPRNIPIYLVVGMLFIGGGLSLIFTTVLFNVTGTGAMEAHWAPVAEEPAKLLALCLFLWKPKYKYTLNGILIGGAIGAGFAAIETMGYFLKAGASYDNLLLRGLLSPGGHVVWAALYGGALAMSKGADKLRPAHFANKTFLKYFAISCILHFVWNYDGFYLYILQLRPGMFLTAKHVLLIVIAWFFLLRLIKLGVAQCMRIPQTAPASILQPQAVGLSAGPAAAPYAMTQGFNLRGLMGLFQGNVFPSPGGRIVIGRDNRRANVVYPLNTPGISSVHCEIYHQNGVIYIIDKNSSNGTFFADGTRLTPENPYPLPRRNGFYLGTRENMFEIE